MALHRLLGYYSYIVAALRGQQLTRRSRLPSPNLCLRHHCRNDFVEIIEMLDKRLNDKGKNWRHVFKSLTLLDYMLHSGSENVVMYFRCAHAESGRCRAVRRV